MQKSWIALGLLLVFVVSLAFWATSGIITKRSLYVSAVEARYWWPRRSAHPYILRATEHSIFREFWTVRQDGTQVRGREFFTRQTGKLEFTEFDPSQKTVLGRFMSNYDREEVQGVWDMVHKTYHLGSKWPSAQQVEASLKSKGWQPSECLGRKAYLERRNPMVRIWYDVRTGILLRDQIFIPEKNQWVDSWRLEYAKWVLRDGDREVVYEIRCEQPPKQAGKE